MATVKDWQALFSRVKAALRRRGCTSDDADDLVQEAYLKLAVYQAAHEVARPDAFLMRTALNLATDAYRMQRNHGESVLLEELTAEEQLLANSSPSAEDIVLARERVARLSESVASMSTKTREIYLAQLTDGMSYQEIATAQGLSVSAVEKRVAKATVAVTRWMEGW